MSMSTSELGALATAVATALGEGWRVRQQPAGSEDPAVLAGPDGARGRGPARTGHWQDLTPRPPLVPVTDPPAARPR